MTAFFRGTFASFPKPLSEEEESEYIQRCKDGDTQARDLLIEHNLRLVAHIAKKYTTSGRIASVDFDDIISIGSIGLIKAIDSFNSGKSARLATGAAI